jgi:peroxiredoxin
MSWVVFCARATLACVFVTAGIGKIVDFGNFRHSLQSFGTPIWASKPLTFVLPILELAVAILLFPAATAWWGLLGALSLLVIFSMAIGINMALGKRPDCHCFGKLNSEPIGWSTLVRNGALFCLTALTLWSAHNTHLLGPTALFSVITIHILPLTVGTAFVLAVIVQSWFALHLLRQNGRLLLRIEALEAGPESGERSNRALPTPHNGLPLGSLAPNFSLPSATGSIYSLDALRAAGKTVLLIFTDPNCGPCKAVLSDAVGWQRHFAQEFTVVLVSRGSEEANVTIGRQHGLAPVLIQKDREVAARFQAHGTPAGVLIKADGTIGSGVAFGGESIRHLIVEASGKLRANRQSPSLEPPNLESLAVPFALPDLMGKRVQLEDFRGKSTLLLFWNPSCGFCMKMLPSLRNWEKGQLSGATQLLVISTGTLEQSRAMNLRSTVLLDQTFALARSFGASGTPSAVVIDAEGKIASKLAVGAESILKLANSAPHQQVESIVRKEAAVQLSEA